MIGYAIQGILLAAVSGVGSVPLSRMASLPPDKAFLFSMAGVVVAALALRMVIGAIASLVTLSAVVVVGALLAAQAGYIPQPADWPAYIESRLKA